jgi:hypothetical protein
MSPAHRGRDDLLHELTVGKFPNWIRKELEKKLERQ